MWVCRTSERFRVVQSRETLYVSRKSVQVAPSIPGPRVFGFPFPRPGTDECTGVLNPPILAPLPKKTAILPESLNDPKTK